MTRKRLQHGDIVEPDFAKMRGIEQMNHEEGKRYRVVNIDYDDDLLWIEPLEEGVRKSYSVDGGNEVLKLIRDSDQDTDLTDF